MVIRRFDIVLVNLDPVVGDEMRKTRPCLVISPDEMNRTIDTFIVAPMTTKGRAYPTRVPCTFRGKSGQVVLDQTRTIDRARIASRPCRIAEETQRAVLAALQEMFSE